MLFKVITDKATGLLIFLRFDCTLQQSLILSHGSSLIMKISKPHQCLSGQLVYVITEACVSDMAWVHDTVATFMGNQILCRFLAAQ